MDVSRHVIILITDSLYNAKSLKILKDFVVQGPFAESEVPENFKGFCGPRTRTCKLVLKDPRGQGLSSRTTTLVKIYVLCKHSTSRMKVVFASFCIMQFEIDAARIVTLIKLHLTHTCKDKAYWFTNNSWLFRQSAAK